MLSPDLWPLAKKVLPSLASFGKKDEMEGISMYDSPAAS